MSRRHEKLGIKQTIQKSWMDRVLRMMLSGMNEEQRRQELDQFLSTQKQSGGIGERGKKTYGMAIGILSAWFAPEKELVPFRDSALALARILPENEWLALHWAVISASYPFWFNVAKQVGRLLNLQGSITRNQIFNRIKELYGDRETVERNARYTVRSFIAWDVLQESGIKGYYKRSVLRAITNKKLAIVMSEAALLAHPDGKLPLEQLLHNPAFYPFQLPSLTGDYISDNSLTIEVLRHGLNNEIMMIA